MLLKLYWFNRSSYLNLFLRHRKYKLQRPTVVQCKQSIQTYPLTQTKTTFASHHEYSFPLRERPNNCRAAQIKSLLSVCFVIGMREREREHLYRIINIAHMHFHKVSNKNCGPLSICLRSLDISIKYSKYSIHGVIAKPTFFYKNEN